MHSLRRHIGGDKIPQYWGRPSPYTGGTEFLGTPTNHMDVSSLRWPFLATLLSPSFAQYVQPRLRHLWACGIRAALLNQYSSVRVSVCPCS